MYCESQVAGLMLAAGCSRRFGSDKRQSACAGRTLLGASLQAPTEVFNELWLVLRAGDDAVTLGVPPPVRIVLNHAPERGMGSSLACGMLTLAAHSEALAVAILLGDMPWVEGETLRTLCAQASSWHILQPTYRGVPGHPVLFGRDFWPALQALEGDVGARAVVQANPHCLRRVAVEDAGILRDVDCPDALRDLNGEPLPHGG